MFDVLLDEQTGDIANTENGDLVLAGEQVATKQYIKQKLKLFFGEWFLGITSGIPYLDEVFVKSPDWNVLDAIFKNEILTAPNIVELSAFDMVLDGQQRLLRVRFRAIDSDGNEIGFDELLP